MASKQQDRHLSSPSNRQPRFQLDPYNQPVQLSPRQDQQHHQQYQYPDYAQYDANQIAYDSMSTILEVDSEGTGSDASDVQRVGPGSPLEIRTQTSPELGWNQQQTPKEQLKQAQVSPVLSRLSSEDKFKGTLSALTEQIERLRRHSTLEEAQRAERRESATPTSTTRASTSLSNTTSLPDNEQDDEHKQQDASTSTPSSLLGSDTHNDQVEEAERLVARKSPNSRANSTESLMMITLSPMISPRIRLPTQTSRSSRNYARKEPALTDSDQDDEESRKVVELCNKSTITAIDMSLMNRMAEKYFVDRRDKGTQSIKFDCEQQDETIELGGKSGSYRNRSTTGANQPVVRPVMKSIGVGTEKFARERFSLLPSTKTRSTQTKSNMDNDIGTSETRKFKLSHLDFLGPMRRSREAAKLEESKAQPEASASHDEQQSSDKNQDSISSIADKSMSDESKADQNKSPTPLPEVRVEEFRNELRNSPNSMRPKSKSPQVSITPEPINKVKRPAKVNTPEFDSLNESILNASKEQSNVSSKTLTKHQSTDSLQSRTDKSDLIESNVGSSTESSSRKLDNVVHDESLQVRLGDKRDKVADASESAMKTLIPSVKTELRVIIEFNNSKQRQRSEVTSNSKLVDGKLSKKTEVSTTKHVVASPRDVFNKLQSAGREHSLMFRPDSARTTPTPASAVVAANEDAIRFASAERKSSSHSKESKWREVSRSSVRNEIETDTRDRHRSDKQTSTLR